MKSASPTPSIEDVIFLLRQLDTIDHARDHDGILTIAKKHDIYTISNHKGRKGRPSR